MSSRIQSTTQSHYLCLASKLNPFSVIFNVNRKQHLFTFATSFWLCAFTSDISIRRNKIKQRLQNTILSWCREKDPHRSVSKRTVVESLSRTGSSSSWAAAQSWKLKMCRKAREGTSVWVVFKSKSEEEKMFLCPPSTGNIISLLYRCPSHPSGLHLSLPLSSFSTSSISSSSSSSSQPRLGCDSN